MIILPFKQTLAEVSILSEKTVHAASVRKQFGPGVPRRLRSRQCRFTVSLRTPCRREPSPITITCNCADASQLDRIELLVTV
jgi:hypothetical protein